METIYTQHDRAFSNVSAYAILVGGEQKGTIAIKYPKDGAGRLTAFVHIHGTEMVKGIAGGYGYDKASAAMESAANKMKAEHMENPHCMAFVSIMATMGGRDWKDALRDNGFTLARAI